MKQKQTEYPIILNHLIIWEYTLHKNTYEEYKRMVIMMLQIKDLFLCEDEILDNVKEDSALQGRKITMELVLQTFPDRYVSAGQRRSSKGEEFKRAWLDLWADLKITSDFPFYDAFFCYKLKHTDLLEIDDFLNYTLKDQYENDIALFVRFIQITLRKYANLINPEIAETIKEWIIETQNRKAPLAETSALQEKNNIKGKLKRESGDNLTKLNQEQTVLLFRYLQTKGVILKDEYLNNTQAGQALSQMTGYSADALRQIFGKNELDRIATKKNLTDLHNLIVSLELLIKNELKGKK